MKLFTKDEIPDTIEEMSDMLVAFALKTAKKYKDEVTSETNIYKDLAEVHAKSLEEISNLFETGSSNQKWLVNKAAKIRELFHQW